MLVTKSFTTGGADSEVSRQKLAFVMRQTPVILGINLLASSFLVGVQLFYEVTILSCVWYGAIALLSSFQLNAWDQFKKQSGDNQTAELMLKRVTLISLLNGVIWGASPFMLPLDGSVQSSLLLAIMVTGMAAGTFSLLSPMPTLVAAFVIPCMLPIIFSCFYYGEPAAAMLAIMGGLLIFGMIRGARISADYFERMHRFASDVATADMRLGEALDCSAEAIAIFDREGLLVKANGAFRARFEGITDFSEMPEDGAYYSECSGKWTTGKSNKTSDDGTIVIHTDITDLKNAAEESQVAREGAEEENRAKTLFLAAVSHELRTPLNAVIGYSDLLKRQLQGPLGTSEYNSYAEKIADGGCRLLRLVNNIIDLAKFESGTYELDSAPVSTDSMIDIVIETLRRSTKDRRQIPVSIEDDVRFLLADEIAVRTALEHVLRNSLTHTSPVDEISISVFVVNGGPCIQIRDAGEGIPLQYLGQVTEPYLQAQTAYNRQHEGLGLGLSVAKAIMRAHGGSIEIESVEGAGTFVDLRFSADSLYAASEMQELRVGT